MFTGLVETLGLVTELVKTDEGVQMTIGNTASILDDCKLGDSIAVDGVCLTVIEFGSDWFKVGIAPETLSRTDLGSRKHNDKVNCERAMCGKDRFGGHFVQGHVDTTAEIVEIVPDQESLRFTFKVKDPRFMLYIVEKGFICVDGASLTITHVNDAVGTFGIMLIAYTQQKVSTATKKVGDWVNVEVDLMGKLVEKQVCAFLNTNNPLSGMIGKIVASQAAAGIVPGSEPN